MVDDPGCSDFFEGNTHYDVVHDIRYSDYSAVGKIERITDSGHCTQITTRGIEKNKLSKVDTKPWNQSDEMKRRYI